MTEKNLAFRIKILLPRMKDIGRKLLKTLIDTSMSRELTLPKSPTLSSLARMKRNSEIQKGKELAIDMGYKILIELIVLNHLNAIFSLHISFIKIKRNFFINII